ncbi:alpha/beta hydrolase [Kitasatospora aureofaciens]|uniref:alpha/beta hydrolase n=1 Tax=Kitasatospora aureofaciens TaxID=1894 RepID=UPI00068F7E2C|nr:alpha/beta hydrolase [Kitasatospora aureofaciens]
MNDETVVTGAVQDAVPGCRPSERAGSGSCGRRPVLERERAEFLGGAAGRIPVEPPDLVVPISGGGPEEYEDDDPYGTVSEWFALPCGPAGRGRVQVTRPVGGGEPSPVVLFLPGLGRSLGDAACYDPLIRDFALGTDAAVVSVEYDRAPAVRYPVAVEQCYAVARWIRAHG